MSGVRDKEYLSGQGMPFESDPEARPLGKCRAVVAGQDRKQGDERRHEQGEPGGAQYPSAGSERAEPKLEQDDESRKRDEVAGGAHGGLWPGGEHEFPVEELDEFLRWAWRQKASDVSFQDGSPALIEVDGVLRRATGAAIDGNAVGRIAERIRGATAQGVLRSGAAVDCSHTVRVRRELDVRFRCNLSPVEVASRMGVNVTMRVLPGDPPALEELGIEAEIVEALEACTGLSLVTGIPGSGKSTLLAAGTRRLLESGVGRIQSYEAPIEFTFDGVDTRGRSLMSSSEIPRHFASFVDGLRASLRRRPAAVVVGEARDRETVEAAINAADFGIAVYSTTHTIGVANTVRRLLSEFPEDERDERGAALIDMLHLVVTQVLLPNPAGGRTAVREWLVFDAALKDELLGMGRQFWPGRISEALRDSGNGLAKLAETAASEGRIGERDLARIRASHGLAERTAPE